VALIGFGLTNLIRNTGAALGIGFVYFAVIETAIRILRPAWEPWLLSNNAAGLISPHGITVLIYDNLGPTGFDQPREYLITNLQAGIVLAVVAAVIIGVGTLLFTRRDLH
jgi:ABC-type transport system involved in multi-copper enzyme maturation permease subunit